MGHANERHLCLAHRPICYATRKYAIDSGHTAFAGGFTSCNAPSPSAGRPYAELKDSTLAQYRADLDRRLGRLLAGTATAEVGGKLAQAI